MTLIAGLRSDAAIVLAAEQEESSGIAGKRRVQKLNLHYDTEWALGFCGAGDAAIIENAERRLKHWLDSHRTFTGNQLADAIDDVLAIVHAKYIDPVPNSEGIQLIVGASCKDGLHLISTVQRTSQFQDFMACAGYGADIAIYFIDRLHQRTDEWESSLRVLGFATTASKEASQYCSGDTSYLILQAPPYPRWRKPGEDFDCEVAGRQTEFISEHLRESIISMPFRSDLSPGYCDEHSPEPLSPEEVSQRVDVEVENHRNANS
jgi:20S proteasome alpha/beta subunit